MEGMAKKKSFSWKRAKNSQNCVEVELGGGIYYEIW